MESYEARLGWLMYEELVLEKAEKKGKEEGEKVKALEIARNLLDLLNNETIAIKIGLKEEEPHTKIFNFNLFLIQKKCRTKINLSCLSRIKRERNKNFFRLFS